MKVVVDTSVWSLALRRQSPSRNVYTDKLTALLKQGRPIVLLGVVLQEILQGIRDPADFEKVRQHLDVFPLLALTRDDYVAAAELRNSCRAQGVRASTMDFQIAAACIRNDCALLTADQDFEHMARFCTLQLL